MASVGSWIGILMGLVILIADIAWLLVGNSYTYTSWLILGIVIFIADIVWLAMDFMLMREPAKAKREMTTPSATTKP